MTSTINDTDCQKAWLLHSAAGACGGALTRLACQPFDVIKIRFQLQVEPLSKNSNNSKYKTIYQTVCLIKKEEGIRALWKGLLPGQLLSITYGLTQFVVFQRSLAYLSVTEKELNQKSSVHFLCGVSASTCATLTSYPFDVVRTRLVAQKSNQIYINMRDVAKSIYKTEGIQFFYRGLYPTIIQNSLQGGLVFMFYNIFSKLTFTHTSTNKTFNDDYLNSAKQLSSGFLSGILSKVLVYPLDLAKKRLQLQDFLQVRDGFGKVSSVLIVLRASLHIRVKFMCNGLLNCFYLTIKEESVLGLFKGISPALLKAGFVTALHLTFYEQSFKLLQYLVKM